MSDLQTWQRAGIRQRIAYYRRSHDGYNVTGKRTVTLPDGTIAFSPILPPAGSVVARRRIRRIVRTSAGQTPGPEAFPAARVPHVATIAITYACQCGCRHCSAALLDGNDTLTTGEFRKVVADCLDLGTTNVVFTGGEPLMNADLDDLVASVDPTRAVTTLFTNGEFLTRTRVTELMAAGLFGVFVSLDHPTAAAHDENRGRIGLFDRAAAAIGACRDLGLPVGISTFATREKLATGEMDALMELGRQLQVLEVFIFDATPVGRLTEQPECTLGDVELAQLRDLRERYNDRPEYPRILQQAMFAASAYPCAAEGCPAASVQMHIRANGDVTPCDFTPKAFGNVRRQSLGDVWRAMCANSLYRGPSSRCRLAHPEFRARLAALPS